MTQCWSSPSREEFPHFDPPDLSPFWFWYPLLSPTVFRPELKEEARLVLEPASGPPDLLWVRSEVEIDVKSDPVTRESRIFTRNRRRYNDNRINIVTYEKIIMEKKRTTILDSEFRFKEETKTREEDLWLICKPQNSHFSTRQNKIMLGWPGLTYWLISGSPGLASSTCWLGPAWNSCQRCLPPRLWQVSTKQSSVDFSMESMGMLFFAHYNLKARWPSGTIPGRSIIDVRD